MQCIILHCNVYYRAMIYLHCTVFHCIDLYCTVHLTVFTAFHCIILQVVGVRASIKEQYQEEGGVRVHPAAALDSLLPEAQVTHSHIAHQSPVTSH